jgi:hypothetical protein
MKKLMLFSFTIILTLPLLTLAQSSPSDFPWQTSGSGTGETRFKTFTRDSDTGLDPIEVLLETNSNSYHWVKEYVDVNYPEYDDSCLDQGGNGSDGHWYDAFEPYVKDKARALSDAIAGLDYEIADYLVKDGRFFQQRPRSWGRFTREISRIDSAIGTKLYTTVVCMNWKKNQESLGYALSCQPTFTTERRTYWVKRPDGSSGSSRKKVAINFEGGFLLPGESETFTISYNGKRVWVDLDSPSLLHTYQVDRDETPMDKFDESMTLRAKARNQIDATWKSASAILQVKNRQLVFRFSDKAFAEIRGRAFGLPAYSLDPSELRDVVQIVLKRDRYGYPETILDTSISGEGEISTPLNSLQKLDRDATYYAEVSFHREGGAILSGEDSPVKRTGAVRYRY